MRILLIFVAVAIVQSQETPSSLVKTYCTPCHNSQKPPKGLDFTNQDIVRLNVVPGDPAKSVIMQALYGMGKPQMPAGREPLTMAQAQIIKRWILSGALYSEYDKPFAMQSMHGDFSPPLAPANRTLRGCTPCPPCTIGTVCSTLSNGTMDCGFTVFPK